MPIFCVKSVKIYTSQKNLHGYIRGIRDKYEVWPSNSKNNNDNSNVIKMLSNNKNNNDNNDDTNVINLPGHDNNNLANLPGSIESFVSFCDSNVSLEMSRMKGRIS